MRITLLRCCLFYCLWVLDAPMPIMILFFADLAIDFVTGIIETKVVSQYGKDD